MTEKQVFLCVGLYFLLIVSTMVWKIGSHYIRYSKRYVKCSKLDNLKSALKDFFNGPINNSYVAVLFILIVIPFFFISTIFGVLLPLIVLRVLSFISGIIFTYYFVRSFVDTVKSIKKEKFKTTIKVKWQGMLAFFMFLLFVYAYVSRLNHL